MSGRIASTLLAFWATGCTTLADVSAGQVGCPPSEIVIADDNLTWGGRTWTAECEGRTYYCSSHGGGEHSTAQISCTPATGANVPGGAGAAPPSPEAGCQYDTQCKGDRVCNEGACVDPAPPAVTAPAVAPPAPPSAPG